MSGNNHCLRFCPLLIHVTESLQFGHIHSAISNGICTFYLLVVHCVSILHFPFMFLQWTTWLGLSLGYCEKDCQKQEFFGTLTSFGGLDTKQWESHIMWQVNIQFLKSFSITAAPNFIPTKSVYVFWSSTPLLPFMITPYDERKIMSHTVPMDISLMASDMGCVFKVRAGRYMSSFDKCLFRSFAFCNCFIYFTFHPSNSLCILDMNSYQISNM